MRYDNGRTAQFDYERIDNLRVGDCVKVEDGKVQRLCRLGPGTLDAQAGPYWVWVAVCSTMSVAGTSPKLPTVRVGTASIASSTVWPLTTLPNTA